MRWSALTLGLALFASGCASTHAPGCTANHSGLLSDDYDECWQAASACLDVVTLPVTSKSDRLDFARQARAHADRAIELDSERVEGHFFRAVSIGQILDNQTWPNLSMIGELEESGIRARELDPSFECSGPLLLLALLYNEAPAWPIGPEPAGEVEVIEALFRGAIGRSPHCTENHVAYAEFLAAQDREPEALAMARRAKSLLVPDECLLDYEREGLRRRVLALLAALDRVSLSPPAAQPKVDVALPASQPKVDKG